MLFKEGLSYAFEYRGKEKSLFVLRAMKLELLDTLRVILLSNPDETVEFFDVQPLALELEEGNFKLLDHNEDEIRCGSGKRDSDSRHGDHVAFEYGDFVIKVYGVFNE